MKAFPSLAAWQQAAAQHGYTVEAKQNARLGPFYVAASGDVVAGSCCPRYLKDSFLLLPPDDPKFS